MTLSNYWDDRRQFREKLEAELLPTLDDFIGEPITQELVDEIKRDVVEYLSTLDYYGFDCEIKVECEKIIEQDGSVIDVVKGFEIIPIDL